MQQKSSKHFVCLNNKKYFYELLPIDDESIQVKCEAANIDQPFLNADVPALLFDLPNLILAEKEYKAEQKMVIRFRVSADDKEAIEKKAAQNGYDTVSAFLRDLALQAKSC